MRSIALRPSLRAVHEHSAAGERGTLAHLDHSGELRQMLVDLFEGDVDREVLRARKTLLSNALCGVERAECDHLKEPAVERTACDHPRDPPTELSGGAAA